MQIKILFIGDGYPVANNAGSILYRRLIKSYGIEHFCYYGVGNKAKLQLPEEFVNMPKNQSSLRIWKHNRFYKYLSKIPLIEEMYYFILRPLITRRIIKFIKRNSINLIIAVFRADVIVVINDVIKLVKLPLLGYISDTIEMEFTDKSSIYNLKYKEYYKAIKAASGIYVASEAMKYFIENNYNKKTSILRLGFSNNLNFNRTITDKINIFFSGSVYAYTEFETFLIALSKFALKYPSYDIKLFMAANYKIKGNYSGFSIINLGWQNEEELYKVMKECHIGYVPYKFDIKYKTQMKYAFPSKAGFYFSCGLPIFFHGPEYSSMSKFFQKYKCGVHCSSLIGEDMLSNLEKLVFDKLFYKYCVTQAEIAFKQEFTIDIMKRNFEQLIDFSIMNNKRNL